MNTENKRVIIAVIRRAVFAGLILLAVWLILLALRGAIPVSVIESMDASLPTDSSTWDWDKSLFTDRIVSETIVQRLGDTLRMIALSGLMSLVLAGLFLLIGELVSKVTKRPDWLVKTLSILRVVLVSGGATAPVFIVSLLFFIIFPVKWQWSMPLQSVWSLLWAVFLTSLLPAWLLVQTGHGILMNQRENTPSLVLLRRVGISLLIRLLKLAGVIVIVTIFLGQVIPPPGLGTSLLSGINMRDFPVIFGVTWVFVIIVVLVKLVAELIEIIYHHLTGKSAPIEAVIEKPVDRRKISKGWLTFSLILVVLIILIALFAPLLAPYGPNEANLHDRMLAPSMQHLLGTDALGRDMLSRVLYGIRMDVLIGFTCAIVLTILAIGWVMLSTHFRKKNNWLGDTLEDLVILPGDIICSFPWLVLLIFLMSLISEYGVLSIALISGLVMFPRTAGMIKEAYYSLPEGKGWLQSILWSIPVALIFTTAGIILYVATISYLGFGVPPPAPELGSMLSGSGKAYMLQAPWMCQSPPLCLSLILLILVMTGDVLLERFGFRSKAVWSKSME
ncbi:MAG: hypothetical protein PHY28_07255 [Dehalococcoidales bacterium]|nr:hypothetical protein [Dehalococcoidales bacterium]